MRNDSIKKILSGLLLSLMVICSAALSFGQSYTYQPPVHPQGSFNSSMPMASYNCSQSQLTLGTPLIQYFDLFTPPSSPDTFTTGHADCHGVIVTAGEPLYLTPAALREFNHANTLTAVIKVNSLTATYVGTFPNCSTPNALVRGWETVTGFTNGGNNQKVGPISACNGTSITVPNQNAISETHSATATNIGYQVNDFPNTQAVFVAPRALFAEYRPNATGYTLGNADNVLSFSYPSQVPTVEWTLAHAFTLNGFITGTQRLEYLTSVSNLAGPLDEIAQPLIIQLTGTTAALTLGDGDLYVQVDYNGYIAF